jgi:hypothetical protein
MGTALDRCEFKFRIVNPNDFSSEPLLKPLQAVKYDECARTNANQSAAV